MFTSKKFSNIAIIMLNKFELNVLVKVEFFLNVIQESLQKRLSKNLKNRAKNNTVLYVIND